MATGYVNSGGGRWTDFDENLHWKGNERASMLPETERRGTDVTDGHHGPQQPCGSHPAVLIPTALRLAISPLTSTGSVRF